MKLLLFSVEMIFLSNKGDGSQQMIATKEALYVLWILRRATNTVAGGLGADIKLTGTPAALRMLSLK